MKVFITGANGFVGKQLCRELTRRNIPHSAGVRNAASQNEVSYGEIELQNNWEEILKGHDVVVHLAARVHVMQETADNPLELFRKINKEASIRLAKAARNAGVKRFIYISSIKVNGEKTIKPFSADDIPHPEDAYGLSKKEAEEELLKIHSPGQFEIVIIRPPLVYGPGVKANFEKLMRLSKRGLPLPFGMVNNKRSLVSVFNLVDLIILCIDHPKAAGQIFLVSDGQDLSLKELLIKMAEAANKKVSLIPVPVSLMNTTFKLLGKTDFAERLLGNLQLDIEKTKTQLQWKPPYTFEQTLREMNDVR